MNFPSLVGLTGLSLLLSVILHRILLFLGVKKQTANIFAIFIFTLSFIPISGYSINQYFRGLFNDLSISSLILMVYYFFAPDNNKSQCRPFFSLIVVIGLFFYPAALGLGPLDPYAWGFLNSAHGFITPLVFLIILSGMMYFAYRKNYSIMLLCLALSTLAYQLEVLESRNLWDYLLDPIIFIYAIFYNIKFTKQYYRNKMLPK